MTELLPNSLIKNSVVVLGEGIFPQQGVDSTHYNMLNNESKLEDNKVIIDDKIKSYLKDLISNVSTYIL